jgi:hypothetical protein
MDPRAFDEESPTREIDREALAEFDRRPTAPIDPDWFVVDPIRLFYELPTDQFLRLSSEDLEEMYEAD